jgi:hypothetical protein
MIEPIVERRAFLQRSGMGMGALGLAGLLQAETESKRPGIHFPAKAEHVIHIFLNGGMSQVDTFDPKPELTKRGGQMLPFDNLQTERKTGVAIAVRICAAWRERDTDKRFVSIGCQMR